MSSEKNEWLEQDKKTIKYLKRKFCTFLTIATTIVGISIVSLLFLMGRSGGSWVVSGILFLVILSVVFTFGVLILLYRWKITTTFLVAISILAVAAVVFLSVVFQGWTQMLGGHSCSGFWGVGESCMSTSLFIGWLLVLNPLSLVIEAVVMTIGLIVQVTAIVKTSK